jgi:hypothetical protein
MSTSLSYSIQFATPKYKKHPPHTPHPGILSIIHHIAAANYWLIVVSYNQTAAT